MSESKNDSQTTPDKSMRSSEIRYRRLNEFEFGLIKEHSDIGYNILKGISFPSPIAKIDRGKGDR